MKTLFIAITLLTLTISLSSAEDLMRLNLDDVSAVTPQIQADLKEKVEGKSSIKITTQWPTTICLSEVIGPNVENAMLVYSAKVKTDLDGNAFLEMWVHVGGGQYFSKGMNDSIGQKTDWKTIKTPFMLQKGQKPDKVTLNLTINGKGTVWIDDIVLAKEPLQ
jgi:hypothetical protein